MKTLFIKRKETEESHISFWVSAAVLAIGALLTTEKASADNLYTTWSEPTVVNNGNGTWTASIALLSWSCKTNFSLDADSLNLQFNRQPQYTQPHSRPATCSQVASLIGNRWNGVTLTATMPDATMTIGAVIADCQNGNPNCIGHAFSPSINRPARPTTGPKPVLNMHLMGGSGQSNLGVTWSWSTDPADYDNETVPANYSVGIFIRNAAKSEWSAFRVDDAPSAAATWAERMNRFHDKYSSGGVRDPARHIFPRGTWCVTTAAASAPETGGTYIEPRGAASTCISVP